MIGHCHCQFDGRGVADLPGVLTLDRHHLKSSLKPWCRSTHGCCRDHNVRESDDSGRISYSRTRRRRSISVPNVRSASHRFLTGTNPGAVSDRLTPSMLMPRTAPCTAKSCMKPGPIQAWVDSGHGRRPRRAVDPDCVVGDRRCGDHDHDDQPQRVRGLTPDPGPP